jgi:hypothetical protein
MSPNGYHYTKTDRGWRLTHHIKMEEILGRPLEEGERVHFVTDNHLNFSKENLKLVIQGTANVRKKIAQLTSRIEDLKRELIYWESQLPPTS